MTDRQLIEHARRGIVVGDGSKQIRLLVEEIDRLNNRSVIGSAVREFRLAKGWAQQDLAEVVGIPQSHVSRIECGKLRPMPRTIRNLAIALGVSEAEITSEPKKE